MKNPRTLNTDYDAWLRRLQVEQLKKFLQEHLQTKMVQKSVLMMI